jgi:hypothetical protein
LLADASGAWSTCFDEWAGGVSVTDYYKTNAFQYRMYRVACGRDPRLADLWGKHQ